MNLKKNCYLLQIKQKNISSYEIKKAIFKKSNTKLKKIK